MPITFGGLSTGLDTNAIIKAIMDVERQPLSRLEKEKEYLAGRLNAFSEFQDKLNALASAMEAMDEADELGSHTATASSDEYFLLSISDSTETSSGSFQVEVVNLAQVQKDVGVGYAARSTADFSAGTITINGTDIAIDADSSLNDIMAAINTADADLDTGVSASIINDGTNYRLVLTGQDADNAFSVSVAGVSDGNTALSFSTTQTAEPAEIVVDGITITSANNSIKDAIPGVTIDLLKEHGDGASTTATVETDFTAITEKLQAFASAYNDIRTFIDEQQDADWGHDSSFRTVRNTLQSLLTTNIGGTGTFNHLVDIGFKTDSKTGTLSINESTLQEALEEDFDSVQTLLLGDNGGTTGILEQYNSFLENWTDSFDGLYAGKKNSHDSSIRSLDSAIERMELRLDKREQTLLSQFNAMELLVNGLNATSSYLSQQTTMLAGLSSGGGSN